MSQIDGWARATHVRRDCNALPWGLKRHKAKEKCGADGNAIYTKQCSEANRTGAILMCKAQLYLLDNVDGHEGKSDTDNATHFAVQSLRKVQDVPNAYAGRPKNFHATFTAEDGYLPWSVHHTCSAENCAIRSQLQNNVVFQVASVR